MDDNLMYYQWLESYIAENSENASWFIRVSIYKNTLKFVAKVWCSMVSHYIAPTSNKNTLG